VGVGPNQGRGGIGGLRGALYSAATRDE